LSDEDQLARNTVVGVRCRYSNYKAFFLLLGTCVFLRDVAMQATPTIVIPLIAAVWGFVALSCAYAIWLPIVAGWWMPLTLPVNSLLRASGRSLQVSSPGLSLGRPELSNQILSDSRNHPPILRSLAVAGAGIMSATGSAGELIDVAESVTESAMQKENLRLQFASQSTYQLIGFVAGMYQLPCLVTRPSFMYYEWLQFRIGGCASASGRLQTPSLFFKF
jgi:hypothetical protein